MRIWINAGLAVAASCVAFWLARSEPTRGTAAPLVSSTATQGTPSDQGDPRPTTAPFVTVRRPSNLSQYEQLLDSFEHDANALQAALIDVTAKSVYDRAANAYACNEAEQLLGPFVIEFETIATVTTQEIVAERWRFVRVRNGSPLSATAIDCLERVLGGPYAVTAQAGHGFVPFEGPIPMAYRINFGSPD